MITNKQINKLYSVEFGIGKLITYLINSIYKSVCSYFLMIKISYFKNGELFYFVIVSDYSVVFMHYC